MLVQTTPQQPNPESPEHPYVLSLESDVEGPEQVSPATQLRKRQTDSDDDDNTEPELKRARLTRRNLAKFDKMGGKKKATNKASASVPLESTADSSTTKTTSTTSPGFATQARDNGILPADFSRPPTNLEDIRGRYARSRGTASPTESICERYVNRVNNAPNEATMLVEVSGKLLKEYDDKGYQRAFNQAFTGFPNDVGFNKGLSAPQPDFVEGLGTEGFRPFPVGNYINGAVLYKDNFRSVTLPHLAGEWKGPTGNMTEAELQSSYDGAALVYARTQALSYLGKADPPGHAEVMTFTTDGINLNLYAHYSTTSEDGTLEYHQYRIKSTILTASHQEYKDGRRGLRNTQDHAREQSYALRDQLKEHWKQRRGGLHPITEAPLPASGGTFKETAPYEDEAGYEIVKQPCQPTSAASSDLRKASRSVSSSKSGQKRKFSLSS